MNRHWADLEVLYQNQVVHAHSKNATRMDVLWIAAAYCAPMLGLALAGLVAQLRRTGAAWPAIRLHVTLLLLAVPADCHAHPVGGHGLDVQPYRAIVLGEDWLLPSSPAEGWRGRLTDGHQCRAA